jgi:hypothetical protein
MQEGVRREESFQREVVQDSERTVAKDGWELQFYSRDTFGPPCLVRFVIRKLGPQVKQLDAGHGHLCKQGILGKLGRVSVRLIRTSQTQHGISTAQSEQSQQ